MPTSTIQRGPMTEVILTQLRVSGITIGDGELPDESWIGQPNLPGSVFEPFVVLSPLTADRSDGPIGDSQGDWRLPYMIEYFGILRSQVEWAADKLRDSLNGLRFQKYQLGVNKYKVQQVRQDSVGQPQLIRVTEPPFWHQQDGITIWLGKAMT